MRLRIAIRHTAWLVGACMVVVTGCDTDGDTSPTDGDASVSADTGGTDGTDGTDGVPTVYEFDSRSMPGEPGVSNTGQTHRQVLISDLKSYIGSLTDQIDGAQFEPTDEGDVVGALDFYFRFDAQANGNTAIGLVTDPPTRQQSYNDLSNRDLVGKLAGNDTATDHKDWSTEFVGWSDGAIAAHGGSVDTPEGLVIAFFETIEAQALERAAGGHATGPEGELLPVHVTPSGLDLQQLVQKFLLMAVNFSQGADDYMDEGTTDKGLEATNVIAEGDAYSDLEHAWDEGFGYFGAARDYLAYTDEEIAGKGGREDWQGYHDSNEDGKIDLNTEYNFGASVNAGKRDLGAVAATDFTAEAMGGFLEGRALIHSVDGELSDEQKTQLAAARDKAVGGWEKAIAATVVHYINDSLAQIAAFGTEDYDFLDYAKGWSEMKGFALGFQFNPRSPLSDAQFAELHEKMGDAPVLPTADPADITAYQQRLRDARAILGTAYGFDEANLGDDNGAGGW